MRKFPVTNPVLTDQQHEQYFQDLRQLVQNNKQAILAPHIQGKSYVITHSSTTEVESLFYHEIRDVPMQDTALGETWIFERKPSSSKWLEIE
ncbi:hypothetical protein [Photobacterium swingsii]|uniref:hypothetical protein n=1 Tax=Photobacterium swingsii TaxID=680026 RepID=UPI00406840CD